MCVSVYAPCEYQCLWRPEEGTHNPLELDWWVMSCPPLVLGNKLGSSSRVVCTLNCWVSLSSPLQWLSNANLSIDFHHISLLCVSGKETIGEADWSRSLHTLTLRVWFVWTVSGVGYHEATALFCWNRNILPRHLKWEKVVLVHSFRGVYASTVGKEQDQQLSVVAGVWGRDLLTWGLTRNQGRYVLNTQPWRARPHLLKDPHPSNSNHKFRVGSDRALSHGSEQSQQFWMGLYPLPWLSFQTSKF